MKWKEIRKKVKTVEGKAPQSEHAVRNAVERVARTPRRGIPTTNYKNSGRRYGPDGRRCMISEKDVKALVQFVKQWRNKRFCTCRYIKQELKLDCTLRTVARTLNRNGFYWRQVARKSPLSPKHLQMRKDFVRKHLHHSPGWWQENMHLVLDGVTLTKAPKSLDARQKHAAQAIRHMWMRKGEKMDASTHTYNRYGVQLGKKVPLWGGFTGDGQFTLRLWTPKAKYKKEEWPEHIPALKRAAQSHGSSDSLSRLQTLLGMFSSHGPIMNSMTGS